MIIRNIVFMTLIFFLLVGCKSDEEFFTTPESTVSVFINAMYAGDAVLAGQCFIVPQDFTGLPKAPYPVQISIKSKKVITEQDEIEMEEQFKEHARDSDFNYREYQFFLDRREKFEKAGDVEIGANINYNGSSYDKIYYLRNIDGKWKLMERILQQ